MLCSWQEGIKTHDAIRDTFATIMWDASFHVGRKELHNLPSTIFNSSRQQIDIVLTKDGICTLVNIVIADPIQVDLLPQYCETQGFISFNATQAKEKNYRNQHHINQFLL